MAIKLDGLALVARPLREELFFAASLSSFVDFTHIFCTCVPDKKVGETLDLLLLNKPSHFLQPSNQCCVRIEKKSAFYQDSYH